MSILDEIRRQSEGVRKIMFGLCVITTISLVGIVWFRSFEKNLFVLMNPSQEAQQKYFAQTGENQSLLGNISKTFKDFSASIGSLFNRSGSEKNINIGSSPEESKGSVHLLPISGQK